MLEVALLALAVPAAAVTLGLALRQATQAADRRGIALQTVIIMVVLVVIGGAVAAVLVSRAGQETDRLENVDSSIDVDKYASKSLCEQRGHVWSSGACTAGAFGTYDTQGPCVEAGHKWTGTACASS